MEKTRIGGGYGYTTYKVTGDFKGLTYDEIADKCDINNFGYRVQYTTPTEIVINVYID